MVRRVRIAVIFAIAAAMATLAHAQPAAFDVASVKPVRSGDAEQDRDQISTSPGRLIMRNVTLRTCIRWAYGLDGFQVTGPGWLASEKYNLDANAPGAVKDDQLRLMLQTLLAGRFKLAFHREKKDLPVYALVSGKGGHKLHESQGDGDSSMKPGRFGFTAQRTSTSQLAEYLAIPLRKPVLDLTGLKGRYDFTLDLTVYATDGRSDPAVLVLTAVQEQLGLKLEAHKGPVEMLVVDRAEKMPAGN